MPASAKADAPAVARTPAQPIPTTSKSYASMVSGRNAARYIPPSDSSSSDDSDTDSGDDDEDASMEESNQSPAHGTTHSSSDDSDSDSDGSTTSEASSVSEIETPKSGMVVSAVGGSSRGRVLQRGSKGVLGQGSNADARMDLSASPRAVRSAMNC